VLPSFFFQYPISGLSDLGHFLISSHLIPIKALWHASVGAPMYEPVQSAYDVFASVISSERSLNDELVDITIPTLVAIAAERNQWLRADSSLALPLDSIVLKRLREFLKRPIERWRLTIRRGANCPYIHKSAVSSGDVDLTMLPKTVREESDDICVQAAQRTPSTVTLVCWLLSVERLAVKQKRDVREY
jgi:hypothetical protein